VLDEISGGLCRALKQLEHFNCAATDKKIHKSKGNTVEANRTESKIVAFWSIHK
jgi:hypothetical protein